MSFIDTDDAFSVAAKRIANSVRRPNADLQLPVQSQPQPTTYIIEPDLMETQTGNMHLPQDVAFDDVGNPYNTITGKPVKVVRRPNVLPIAKTPEGFTFAMPKMLDIAGNVMSPLAAGRVPVKAGEVVLGSGAVRTFKTPNPTQLENIINKTDYKELRGLIDDSGVHVWDAGKSTHHDMAKELGLNYNIDNRLHITPAKDDPGFYNVDFDDKWLKYENLNSNPKLKQLLNNNNLLVNVPGAGRISGPEFLKLYSDTRPQVAGAVGHAIEKNQPFYSGLEQAVANAKVNKADAAQWLGYLKNQPGVKSEELGYVLNNLPEGQITREGLQDIIKNNKVELKEVVKGELKELPEGYEVVKGNNGWNVKSPSGGFIASNFNSAEEAKNGAINFLKEANNPNPTKYHDYQLPGGENYQEMLLTLPDKQKRLYEWEYFDPKTQTSKQFASEAEAKAAAPEGAIVNPKEVQTLNENYKSSHWDEPNILAHVRYNDRDIPEVGKSLHLEEIQSDWHQAGRKQGYRQDQEKQMADLISQRDAIKAERDKYPPTGDTRAKWIELDDKIAPIQTKINDLGKSDVGVPDAPFKKNWDELAFKRMLHKAAVEGYDSVSWTPGEAQAARYDLSKQVDRIDWSKNETGNQIVRIAPKNGASNLNLQLDKDGKVVETFPRSQAAQFEGKHLADVVGKEHAEKILSKSDGSLEGEGLKIGGEGMKSFYDKMLVDKANALAKKYGAKVESKRIKTTDMPMSEYDKYPDGHPYKEKNAPLIHVLKLTPELRAKAKSGFPLFSSTPITTPVDYDPFQSNKKYRLVPIQGNPFNE